MNHVKVSVLLVLIILSPISIVYAADITQNTDKNPKISIDNGSKTIYVTSNGTDTNTGLTNTTPKRTITNAINTSNNGDTIILGPGTYKENLNITKNLTLTGTQSDNTIIDGQKKDSCINIPTGIAATITNITIKNGKTDTDTNIYSAAGGINNEGTLTLKNSTIKDNNGGWGGGITNNNKLTIENSTIKDNNGGWGGGIYNMGKLTIVSSTINNNYADYRGGGIRNYGIVTIENSTIKDNNSFEGGGIENNGTLTIKNSTIKDNNVKNYTFGDWWHYNDWYLGHGGGIHNVGTQAAINIENSKITNNNAVNNGGGIYNEALLTLKSSIVTGNNAEVGGGVYNGEIHSKGILTIEDSIVSNNKAVMGGGIYNNKLLYVYRSVISNNSVLFFGGGILNENKEGVEAYIDAITTITNNTPNNFYGKSYLLA